jgi:hypothetical protein
MGVLVIPAYRSCVCSMSSFMDFKNNIAQRKCSNFLLFTIQRNLFTHIVYIELKWKLLTTPQRNILSAPQLIFQHFEQSLGNESLPSCINSASFPSSDSSVTLPKISNSFPCFTSICSSTDKEISEIRKSLKSAHFPQQLTENVYLWLPCLSCLLPLAAIFPTQILIYWLLRFFLSIFIYFVFSGIFMHLSCDTRLLASERDMHLVYTMQKS